jgi:DNA-binding MarR family transcriptional regulator
LADTPSTTYELVVLLAMAWSMLIDELHSELAKLGYSDLRPAHGFVFQLLAPNGATGNEVAAHLGVTKQAASQMIDFLEEHGYVVRQPHPNDKRGKLVLLTQKGWDCIQAVEMIFARIEERWTETLGPEHMKMLRTDLHRLIADSESGIVSYRLRPMW